MASHGGCPPKDDRPSRGYLLVDALLEFLLAERLGVDGADGRAEAQARLHQRRIDVHGARGGLLLVAEFHGLAHTFEQRGDGLYLLGGLGRAVGEMGVVEGGERRQGVHLDGVAAVAVGRGGRAAPVVALLSPVAHYLPDGHGDAPHDAVLGVGGELEAGVVGVALRPLGGAKDGGVLPFLGDGGAAACGGSIGGGVLDEDFPLLEPAHLGGVVGEPLLDVLGEGGQRVPLVERADVGGQRVVGGGDDATLPLAEEEHVVAADGADELWGGQGGLRLAPSRGAGLGRA